ncbi:hypothetical protein, unknown function [Leishmania mexicana MHOM/GT/2001/U1103]|uniref:Uncharacterized protein n=1 Tax=Leishmania mexicana (strain MHOM/GT/2001/U1103) TaxID=929439 RepID=E9AKC0_LEIMU|nr:hypothetical protein, unknown function [Leishmania mexicana MHOM/GT/2001/U1103]CBZ23371.1 hypothetical protein, unknown function [Leishmania mexicana MHOM/GT/2001/U1103]
MPIIKSCVHADELHAAKDALATANREADALRQQALEQAAQLDERAQQNARLAGELVQAETKLEEAHRQLTEMQVQAQVREEQHREQMHRMAQNVRTLEDMVQASRRREREGSSSTYHRGQSAGNGSTDDAGRARQHAELSHAQGELTHSQRLHSFGSSALQQQPAVPTRGNKAVREQHCSLPSPSAAASPPISAQALYWQEQLLGVSQRAAEGFGEVQRQLRRCLPPSPPSTSPAAAGSKAHPDQEPLAASASPGTDDAYRWSQQLRRLHADFDEVVHADSRLISFLLLVAQQQSQQARTLQERWAEAQSTVREAEAVLDEANARVTRNAQESAVLRQECAVLTETQTALQAQLTNRTREHQAAVTALHRLQEAHAQLTHAHTRQEEMWSTRLTQAAELQQQASNYAQKLEAALLDKERLMSAATASTEQQLRREVLEATKKHVAVFLKQLNASAEQLQSSLASLSHTSPSSALAASAVAGGAVQKVPSAASPEPSPPGASSSAYSASLSP